VLASVTRSGGFGAIANRLPSRLVQYYQPGRPGWRAGRPPDRRRDAGGYKSPIGGSLMVGRHVCLRGLDRGNELTP
jgi:hypothetical protein